MIVPTRDFAMAVVQAWLADVDDAQVDMLPSSQSNRYSTAWPSLLAVSLTAARTTTVTTKYLAAGSQWRHRFMATTSTLLTVTQLI